MDRGNFDYFLMRDFLSIPRKLLIFLTKEKHFFHSKETQDENQIQIVIWDNFDQIPIVIQIPSRKSSFFILAPP